MNNINTTFKNMATKRIDTCEMNKNPRLFAI